MVILTKDIHKFCECLRTQGDRIPSNLDPRFEIRANLNKASGYLICLVAERDLLIHQIKILKNDNDQKGKEMTEKKPTIADPVKSTDNKSGEKSQTSPAVKARISRVAHEIAPEVKDGFKGGGEKK